ncbi:MAG: hypothetical protein QOK19_1772 [Solirubrobacteraceae bacterium]|nr:hypothetical protein [Solirubrobacterales bacterium]MEA2216211.1 hypothetical protein [Solirubrobacteraceae bacterium]
MKRYTRSRASVLLCLCSLAVALGVASPALATPKGEFAIFSDCPLSNSEITACLLAKTESGEFVVGKKTVPITNTITLQGGVIEDRETGGETFVGAADGNTLSKAPQTVPGGLLGVVAPEFLPPFLQVILNEFIDKGVTGVTATTELAVPASSIGINEKNLLQSTGVALTLPVKVHLENAFLGSSCYIGSDSQPLTLNLTTGTTSPPLPNKPIKGNRGTIESNEEGTILTIADNSLVDNAFAAPGASGCGGILSFLVDPAVNATLGVPAQAGHNTAILGGTLKQAGAEVVREHE